MSPTVVQFTAGALEEELTSRINERVRTVAEVASRDLERYYQILEAELPSLALSETEAAALCDLLNGTQVEPLLVQNLWAELEDGLEDGLLEKWDFNGRWLLNNLRAMPLSRLMATADAVERWWALPIDVRADRASSLRLVGLVREVRQPSMPAPAGGRTGR